MSRIRPKAWLSHHRPGASSFKYHFSVAIQGVDLREGMQVPSEVRHASPPSAVHMFALCSRPVRTLGAAASTSPRRLSQACPIRRVSQAKFRVQWKRGDKVASTRDLEKAADTIAFDETLSLVCTMYRDAAQGVYAAKEASFSLLMTGPRSSSTRQLARATLDLSAYAKVEPVSEDMKLVLLHDGEALFFPKHAPPLHPPLPTRPHRPPLPQACLWATCA